jgi:hypothetical protein
LEDQYNKLLLSFNTCNFELKEEKENSKDCDSELSQVKNDKKDVESDLEECRNGETPAKFPDVENELKTCKKNIAVEISLKMGYKTKNTLLQQKNDELKEQLRKCRGSSYQGDCPQEINECRRNLTECEADCKKPSTQGWFPNNSQCNDDLSKCQNDLSIVTKQLSIRLKQCNGKPTQELKDCMDSLAVSGDQLRRCRKNPPTTNTDCDCSSDCNECRANLIVYELDKEACKNSSIFTNDSCSKCRTDLNFYISQNTKLDAQIQDLNRKLELCKAGKPLPLADPRECPSCPQPTQVLPSSESQTLDCPMLGDEIEKCREENENLRKENYNIRNINIQISSEISGYKEQAEYERDSNRQCRSWYELLWNQCNAGRIHPGLDKACLPTTQTCKNFPDTFTDSTTWVTLNPPPKCDSICKIYVDRSSRQLDECNQKVDKVNQLIQIFRGEKFKRLATSIII